MAGVVKAAPVNKRLPPVAASYHLKLVLETNEAAVNVVVDPVHTLVVPLTPLTVGVGLTVMVNNLDVPQLFVAPA